MAKLVPKTPHQLISALEDHLYLLVRTIDDLATGEAAHQKALAAELRALVCQSKGTPGLLWDVAELVPFDDVVGIRYPGKININNPLAKGLYFAAAGPRTEGVPVQPFSLRHHLREHEAVFVDGESVTPQELISLLANQAGVAHEVARISRLLAKVNAVRLGDVQAYFAILDAEARLVAEVGERAVQAAAARGYVRRRAPAPAHSPALELERTRFLSPPDLPEISPQLNEGGSFAFTLYMVGVPQHGRLERPHRFPPASFGNVVVRAEISRRRRICIATIGLPIPNFGFELPLGDPLPEAVRTMIRWKGMRAEAWANGDLVAGYLDAPRAE